MNEKMCAMCYEVKPITEFKQMKKNTRYRMKDGTLKLYTNMHYDCYCMNCRRAFNREYRRFYYEMNKDRVQEINNKSRRKSRERKKELLKSE